MKTSLSVRDRAPIVFRLSHTMIVSPQPADGYFRPRVRGDRANDKTAIRRALIKWALRPRGAGKTARDNTYQGDRFTFNGAA